MAKEADHQKTVDETYGDRVNESGRIHSNIKDGKWNVNTHPLGWENMKDEYFRVAIDKANEVLDSDGNVEEATEAGMNAAIEKAGGNKDLVFAPTK